MKVKRFSVSESVQRVCPQLEVKVKEPRDRVGGL